MFCRCRGIGYSVCLVVLFGNCFKEMGEHPPGRDKEDNPEGCSLIG
jgi:hypothetical protein